MHVTVKLYATLSRYGSSEKAGAPFDVEIAEGATLRDLVALLKIPTEETRILFVNGIIQEPDYRLKSDDEVGIFPPIGGG
jgi:molybdopterin converting factor small subunit